MAFMRYKNELIFSAIWEFFMKFVKQIVPLLLILAAIFGVGCTKTKYDDKQVVRIETQIANGEGLVGYRKRLFDFESGTVTDEAVVCDNEFEYLLLLYEICPSNYPAYESAEEYREYVLAHYNVPVFVAEFSQEDWNGFVSAAQSFGIYTWQEEYIYRDIYDASYQTVIITFADGTTKTTRCYCQYPKNFEKVEAAFQDYFGVCAWCELRLR